MARMNWRSNFLGSQCSFLWFLQRRFRFNRQNIRLTTMFFPSSKLSPDNLGKVSRSKKCFPILRPYRFDLEKSSVQILLKGGCGLCLFPVSCLKNHGYRQWKPLPIGRIHEWVSKFFFYILLRISCNIE